MIRFLTYTILGAWAAVGCRREVFYPTPDSSLGSVPVRIELTWSARPQLPSGFYACFYPLESRPFVDFLDPYGGVLSLNPGHYSVLLFNNDTQKVRYRNTTSYHDFEAYVPTVERPSLVAGAPAEQGIAEPDRLFVASVGDVEVLPSIDTLRIEQSPVRFFSAYSFTVQGITGLENLSAIQASLSGMAPWIRLSTGELGQPSATIFLNFRRTEKGIEGGFSTFGHYDDPTEKHLLTLEMRYQGRLVTRTYDVTQMLHQTGRIDVVDMLDFPAVEGGGGFDPEVGGWDKDTVNIPMIQ